jgi:hypothetical protein
VEKTQELNRLAERREREGAALLNADTAQNI